MPDLIPPHGGLAEPLDLTVPEDERDAFVAEMNGRKKLPVSSADLSTVYRFGDGALSPLEGPMTKDVFDRVLADAVIVSGDKEYAWTIPLALPVDAELAAQLKAGDDVALCDDDGAVVGELAVADVYEWDKQAYLKGVYQTDRHDHPGGDMVLADDRTHLVGGKVRVLPQPVNEQYGRYVVSPREMRSILRDLGWERAVAFQTRNPLHRAHEYALIYGLEKLTRDGFDAGAVLNPLIGETKSDDVDAATRMKTYEALIDSGAFGEGDVDEDLWNSKPYDFKDRVKLYGLDIKMFYGGPKEAVMHAIYRQNYGFTDIIIGRKHADAPYHDRTDIWDALAAQEIFDDLRGELRIQPVKVGFAAFFEELGRVGLVDEYGPQGKGYKTVSISGREVRDQLKGGSKPDPRIMRGSTAEILIAAMKDS